MKIINWFKEKFDESTIAAVILTAVLIVSTIIIIYYYFWVIFFLAAGLIWLFIKARDVRIEQEARKRQLLTIRMDSLVYILNHALTGLYSALSLPNMPGWGQKSVQYKWDKNGVLIFLVKYARMPNAPGISPQTLEQFRGIINNYIKNNAPYLVYPQGTMWIDFYVVQMLEGNGELHIIVIPIIDQNSRDYVQKHMTHTQKQANIGNFGGNTGGNMPNTTQQGQVYDDEL